MSVCVHVCVCVCVCVCIYISLINCLFQGVVDNRDLFCLEACYGLTRLLPRQIARLGDAYLAMFDNRDRPMPERVNAAMRWTLMTTTTYAEIVRYLNARRGAETEAENSEKLPPKPMSKKKLAEISAKVPKQLQPLSVNLEEALLKGCMHTDEPCVSLRFLLAPRFLAYVFL